MRYTEILGKIIMAVEQLKIEEANIKYPEAVRTQLRMWEPVLRDGGYSSYEIRKIQGIIGKYLGIA